MKNFSRISTLVLAAAVLAAAGCSSSSNPASTATNTGASSVYVSDQDPGILGYAAASSSGTATSTVNGPSGDAFIGVATDAGGNLYTVDQSTAGGGTTYTVNEYAAGSNSTGGAVTSTMRSFTSTAIVSAPTSITVDASGNIYLMMTGGTVLRFAASSSGAVTPAATLTGLANISAMTTDRLGNLYVTIPVSSTDSHNLVLVYGAGYASEALPVRNIMPSTEMDIASLAVDANGNVYATGTDSNGNVEVAAFASSSSGSSTATRVITGANTKLINPWQVQVDSAGNIFVGDSTTGAVGGTAVVYKFASTATGNVAPGVTITTSVTYAASTGLAIH